MVYQEYGGLLRHKVWALIKKVPSNKQLRCRPGANWWNWAAEKFGKVCHLKSVALCGGAALIHVIYTEDDRSGQSMHNTLSARTVLFMTPLAIDVLGPTWDKPSVGRQGICSSHLFELLWCIAGKIGLWDCYLQIALPKYFCSRCLLLEYFYFLEASSWSGQTWD